MDYLEIDVEDPKLNNKKCLKCIREVVVQEIPYFKKYLKDEQSGYQVRI